MVSKIPVTVERIVDALCADYDRRRNAISGGGLESDTDEFYRELNSAIEESVSESCEEGIRAEMLRDLKLRRGYNRSMMYGISEGAYKRRKRLAKYIIARRLNYI